MSDRVYSFSENDPNKLVVDIMEKYNNISIYLMNRGIMARWNKSFASYYGFYYSDYKAAYGLGTGGSQGEMTFLAINQFRNLIQHILALITQNKVSFDAIPLNSDVEGRNASIVGNSTLEYIFEQVKYSQEFYQMVESGLIFGTSFLRVSWDTDKNLAGVDENMKPVFSGELSIKSFNPLDVVLEPFKTRFEEQNWICTREIVNRFDLVSRYPELEKEIFKLPRITDIQLADPYFAIDENHVFLFKSYHKSTLAIPFGRYTIFGSDDCIFEDHKENPYCYTNPDTGLPLMGTGIPIVCFRPAVTYGSAFGHTVAFDLLPLQDMKNMLSSTIASNQASYGVQNLVVARGTNFDFADVANGLRMIEVDLMPELGPTGGIPQILRLLETPPEIFKMNDKIDEEMEKISGINGALRGTPPPQVASGTAMALLTTQAQTFNTQIENVYINCLQEAANMCLKTIAKFMPDSDLSKIAGIKENYAIFSFKAEELSKIQKVKVLTGNAMSKSPAGRLAIAQDMMNSGQISPAEYSEVVETGSIKSKTEDVTAQDALIQYENQQMIQGIEVPVLLLDNPLKHILGHQVILNHPDVRNDPQKQQIILKHITEHQQNWVVLGRQNPQLLALITGSPIPPDVPNPGITPNSQGNIPNPEEAPESHAQMGGSIATEIPHPGGLGVNNLANASTPGGDGDLAASAMKSATKLLSQGRK